MGDTKIKGKKFFFQLFIIVWVRVTHSQPAVSQSNAQRVRDSVLLYADWVWKWAAMSFSHSYYKYLLCISNEFDATFPSADTD